MLALYMMSVYSFEVNNDDTSDLMVLFFDLPNNVYCTVDDVFRGLST